MISYLSQFINLCSSFHRSVPYVGTVVDGILNSGSVKAGDAVLLGPDSNGNFLSTAIKSIQRKRSVSVRRY